MAIAESFAFISAFKNVYELWRQIREDLPDDPRNQALKAKLEEAEKAALVAEAQAAQSLGYEIHRCTWPPQIMLEVVNEDMSPSRIYECPQCRTRKDTNQTFLLA